MEKKANQAIINLAQSYGFDGVKFMTEWNEYEVYSPIYNDPKEVAFIGEPKLILYDGKDARIAATTEWQQILDLMSEQK